MEFLYFSVNCYSYSTIIRHIHTRILISYVEHLSLKVFLILDNLKCNLFPIQVLKLAASLDKDGGPL